MTIRQVIEQLTALADIRAHGSGPDDSTVLHFRAMSAAVEKLHTAAVHTIEENLNLADGDNCTLYELREAIDFKHPPED